MAECCGCEVVVRIDGGGTELKVLEDEPMEDFLPCDDPKEKPVKL